MSKYIKLENLKWHSPDESIVKPLIEFYITESDIADLPTIEASEDAISREYMLRALNGYGKDWQEDCEIADVIRNAPSVVPTNDNLSAVEDCISRTKAIKEVKALPNTDNGYSDTYDKALIISVLEELPSVTTEQSSMVGEWTNAGILTVHCSNCKSQFHELEAMNYCPNCGAKMKG